LTSHYGGGYETYLTCGIPDCGVSLSGGRGLGYSREVLGYRSLRSAGDRRSSHFRTVFKFEDQLSIKYPEQRLNIAHMKDDFGKIGRLFETSLMMSFSSRSS
jgi:hypothetical protein